MARCTSPLLFLKQLLGFLAKPVIAVLLKYLSRFVFKQ